MKEITLKTAKQIASRIHSKYKEDSKPPTGNQNCQLCTWCAEAQFRGLDVLPRPIYSPRDLALEIKGETIVKDPTKIKIRNKDHIVSTVKDNPGSRYYIHVKWNGGTGGHEFLIINIDSNVYTMDAQQGLVESIDKTTYFDDVDYSGSYFARLDDKQLNRELLDKMNSMKTLVPWDWDKDVAYMKKHGMLGEDEEIITQDGIGFRAAKTEDIDQLLEWSLATIPKEQRDKDKIIDMERNDIKDNLKYVKVIVDNVTGKDIGMYEAYPTKWNTGRPVKNGDWFYLDKIFIVEEYRGRKIGSTIIKNAIDMHDKLFLGVDKDNTRAKKLYETFGFRVIEEYPYSYVMALDKTNTTDFRFVRIYVPSDKATEYLKKDQELKQYWETLNKETNGEILVDPNTQEQIGYGFVYKSGKNKGFIFNIEVMEKFRRQGFGTIILNDCVTKFGGVDLTVSCDNEGAIKLYLKYGFEIVETVKGKNGRDEYYMKLKKSKAVQEGFVDASTVCHNLANELRKFKYGLIRNGKLDTNPPDEDYDRYWKLATPEEFEQAGGGICYDFVEWEADYLRKYGIMCNRFLLAQAHGSDCNSTHSFIVVRDGKKYIYIEGSFENVSKKINGYKAFDSLQAIFKYVAREVKACEPDAKTMRYIIFMYSDAVPKAGSDINQFQKYVVDNGTELFEGIIPVEPSDEKPVQEGVDMITQEFDPLKLYSALNKTKTEYRDKLINIGDFDRVPLNMATVDEYNEGHGHWVTSLSSYRVNDDNFEGTILVDENGICAGYLVIETRDDTKWIVGVESSMDYKSFAIVEQLLYLARTEYDAMRAVAPKTNKALIECYLDNGWKVSNENPYLVLLKYEDTDDEDDDDENEDDNEDVITEYMFLEASSNKLMFHVSDKKNLDGQVFRPRVPEYIDPYDPKDKYFENSTTPRVCFSPTIDGALNAITVTIQPTNPVTFEKLYVYVPEKPFNQYKHKTNKEIIRDKDVYDANVTGEAWILEPVRLRLYGVIRVDQNRKVKRKNTVPTSENKRGDRNVFSYRWHWLVKPKVISSTVGKVKYDAMAVCDMIARELYQFKYGLCIDGRKKSNATDADYDKYWRLQSPEQFEQSRVGNCYDFTEWEAGFLDTYYVKYKKYFINAVNGKNVATHTFVVVPDNGKYIYLEGAFKRVADEIHHMKVFDKLEDIFEYIVECMVEIDNVPEYNYGVWDYTDNGIKPGTDIKHFQEDIFNGDPIHEGNVKRKKE